LIASLAVEREESGPTDTALAFLREGETRFAQHVLDSESPDVPILAKWGARTVDRDPRFKGI